MKRLVAKNMYSKPTMELNGFMTDGGIYYQYSVRLLNNKPMYSIFALDTYDTSSLYDGESFEESFEFFCELAMALKGIRYAEDFAREKQLIQDKIFTLKEKSQDMTLKMRPLSLGDSEFING